MDKGQFKAAVIGSIGQKIEEMLEAARADKQAQHRANQYLLGVVEDIDKLVDQVDKDIEEGLYDGIGEPLLVAKIVKQYIVRASAVVGTAAEQAANARLTCEGRVQSIELIIKNLKKEHDTELAKSEARRKAEEAGDEDIDMRELPDGSHAAPAPSLKARRAVEEQAEKMKDAPPKIAQADVPKVPAATIRKKPTKKPPKKPRKR